MHIAFVSPSIEYYSPTCGGAVATYTMQAARRLIGFGHRVSVLTPTDDKSMYDVGDIVEVARRERHQVSVAVRAVMKLHNFIRRWDQPYYEPYLRSVLRALRRLTPDAVVCFNDLRTPIYVRRVLSPGARLAVRLSNEVPTRQRSLRRTAGATDAFLCVSGYIRNWLLRTHPVVRADQALVLANGSDLDAFHPRESFAEASTGPLRVLFVGRAIPIKGPDVVVDAVRTLRDDGLAVDVTVAGARWWYGHDKDDDPYQQRLRESVTACGGKVLGHVVRQEIPALMRSHDVVCIPSRFPDPMPQVALEAMASGCAVVASARGGIAEACGDAAMYADPDHPETFAAALRRFASDSALLASYKRRAVARSQTMTWDDNVDLLLQTLQPKTSRSIEASEAPQVSKC